VRIGIFDPYLDTLGGGEKYMLTAASYLSEDNVVDVFWDSDGEIFKKAGSRFGIDLSRVKLSKNIFSKKVSFFSRIAASKKYDIIFFLSDGSIPVIFPKKVIVHFQFPVEWVDGKSVSTKIKLAFVSKIICNSKFTKKFIDRSFGKVSVVLYPACDIETKNSKLKSEHKENLILTVGRFGKIPEGESFKKQDFMINVFKKMMDKGLAGWEFILVISYREEDMEDVIKLERSIKGYPIKILKNLDRNEISKIYQKAKIYWHAAGFGEDLKKHPERAEHFGISTVEAMGAGAAPVVINSGGQKEIVVDGKSGFLWNTKEELMEKTDLLIKKSDLLEKISSQAIQRAVLFNKDRFCRELREIIS